MGTYKKPRDNRLSQTAVRERQARVLQLHANGNPPEVIARIMGMRVNDVSRDIRIATERMVRHFADASPEHTFIRYAAFQLGIIQRLDIGISTYLNDPNTKQYTAYVSALKAQSDIYDKILDKGVAYGVITQKKADKSIRDEPAILKKELKREIKVVESLVQEIGVHEDLKSLKKRNRRGGGKDRRVAYVRRVQRSELGIVRDGFDWRFARGKAESQVARYTTSNSHPNSQVGKKDRVVEVEDPSVIEDVNALRRILDAEGVEYEVNEDGSISPAKEQPRKRRKRLTPPPNHEESLKAISSKVKREKNEESKEPLPSWLVKPRS